MPESGQKCVTKSSGAKSVQTCSIVNAHDAIRQVQGLARFTINGVGITWYCDYVSLRRSGTEIKRIDPNQGYTIGQTLSTPWFSLSADCSGKTFTVVTRYKIQWTPGGVWTGFFTVTSLVTPTIWCD